jgi:hypothetical protein
MFGATPGVYRKSTAAYMAARAFTSEESEPWIVMFKVDDAGGKWFCPCRLSDQPQAEVEKYIKVDLETLNGLVEMVLSDRRDDFTEALADAIQDKNKINVIRAIHSFVGFDLVLSKKIADSQMEKWIRDLT